MIKSLGSNCLHLCVIREIAFGGSLINAFYEETRGSIPSNDDFMYLETLTVHYTAILNTSRPFSRVPES
jgi:hypothetical protein